MTKINMETNASYNFVAPKIDADANRKIEVVFPTSEVQTVEATATTEVIIERLTTLIDLGELSSNCTLNAIIGEDIPVGANLTVKAKSDTTARTITWGSGFVASAMSGTSNKTKVQSFIYDGEVFIAKGASAQLD